MPGNATRYRLTLIAAARAAETDLGPAARARAGRPRDAAPAPWPGGGAPRAFREGERAGVAGAGREARRGAPGRPP